MGERLSVLLVSEHLRSRGLAAEAGVATLLVENMACDREPSTMAREPELPLKL